MIGVQLMASNEEPFQPPDIQHAFFHDPIPALQISSLKAMVLIGISVVLISLVMIGAASRSKVLPGRLAFMGESVYGFVRNGVAVEVLGQAGRRYAPLLTTIFLFVLVNNLFGIIPFAQHAPTSQFAVPVVLALLT